LEMTMSRRSTLVKDTIWEVNGLGWGILWIRGKTRSLNRERHFSDPKGNSLFVMQKQDLSTRVAQTADGRVLFSIKRALGLKPQFSAEFTNVWDEQAVTWDVKGSPARRGLDVTCNGVQIGSVTRPKSGLREMFSETCTYVVTLGPGLDYTIMAAITVAYDDIRVHEGISW